MAQTDENSVVTVDPFADPLAGIPPLRRRRRKPKPPEYRPTAHLSIFLPQNWTVWEDHSPRDLNPFWKNCLRNKIRYRPPDERGTLEKTPFDNESLRAAVRDWFEDQEACEALQGKMEAWDVSRVTDMSFLFEDRESFDENITAWDTRNVTDMKGMFKGCFVFNWQLRFWAVENVVSRQMFGYDAHSLRPTNQPQFLTWD